MHAALAQDASSLYSPTPVRQLFENGRHDQRVRRMLRLLTNLLRSFDTCSTSHVDLVRDGQAYVELFAMRWTRFFDQVVFRSDLELSCKDVRKRSVKRQPC